MAVSTFDAIVRKCVGTYSDVHVNMGEKTRRVLPPLAEALLNTEIKSSRSQE